MIFLQNPSRFYFFTGKGGVGKTSIACATAVHLARQGRRVLLVSTDPASNVGQVFGARIGATITAIPGQPRLDALEIDPEEVAEAYRERTLAPVRGILPVKELQSITEQLSGSCTTEIASFNEFTRLLGNDSVPAGYDHIIFDTAPTGHTLRLLELPGSWTDFLNEGKGDASCLGPMSGLDQQRQVYADAVAALQDGDRTRMVLIARPQESSIREALRTHRELVQLGIVPQHLLVNGVLGPAEGEDELADAIREREQAALSAALSSVDPAVQVEQLALRPVNMVGPDALEDLLQNRPSTVESVAVDVGPAPAEGLGRLVDELEVQGHGLVMTMGKGGVGKTTTAAAIAVALAARGHDVHLTTTDPASHLALTLAGDLPGLSVSSIDPDEATRAYRENVLATKGKTLDEAGRAALTEDLMSPCTEEIAVFQAFSKVVSRAAKQFVVMDTAPTGHTLLLLDATGSYHRDVVRHLGDQAKLTTPMMRLQDPEHTKVIVVTLPETTPVLEAEHLSADLERAGITPWAWVVNNSLLATSTSHPVLRARAALEAPLVDRVVARAPRCAVVATQTTEPVGIEALLGLTDVSALAPA